jgi:hypothetical protein
MRTFSDATAQGLRLRRRRRLSPPAPRPAALAAGPVRPGLHPCGRPAHDGPGRYAPALAWACSHSPAADPSAIAGAPPGATPHPLPTASGPWPTCGRGHVTLIAGAADSPSTSLLAARYLRLSSGQGHVTLVAGDRQLTVSRPAGRAVLATAFRAGARVLDAARSLIAGDGHSTPRRPVGRAAPALPDRSEARGLASQWMSPLHAGQSAAPPRFHCARARGRAGLGPVGCSSSLPLCPGPRPGRTRLGPYTTPAGGRTPAGSLHRRGSQPSRQTLSVRQVWGTDSDTSWRRRGRRSRTTWPARGTCGPGPDDSAR